MMHYVEIKKTNAVLRGMVHSAGKINASPVVIVHGYFSANRIGPQRLFVKLANSISECGFDVYRFDLTGMGESDGDISHTSFFDHASDIETIIDFVRSRHLNKEITLVAHCLGCNISLVPITSHLEYYKDIVFLAPYYSTDNTITAMFSKVSIHQLKTDEYTYRNGQYVHASYFHESTQENFVNEIRLLDKNISVIIPEKDQFIPLNMSTEMFNSLPNVTAYYIPKADHNFLGTHDDVISCVMRIINDKQCPV